ncbi:MAG: hypothetical protein Ct9H300mP1_02290 [Planctomycetaceae bacterium]|nr:MAG: hypothetical protein Ct9H300mP1_02290 [Planctomycetaceae bacterium]
MHDAVGGRRTEDLISLQSLVPAQVRLDHWDALLFGQFEHSPATDSLQDVPRFGRKDGPVFDQEDVPAGPLGHEPVGIEQHRPGPFADSLSLQFGHLVVHPAPGLGLGVNQVGRQSLLGGNDNVDTVVVLVGKRAHVRDERPGTDRHRRPGALRPQRPVNRQRPARHVVHHPPVHPLFLGRPVLLERQKRLLLHLLLAQPAVDFEQSQRPVKPVEVFTELERLPAERASHLEGHVSIHQGTVEDRDVCIALGNKITTEIDNASGHDEDP